jgi:hypothetical protein
LVQWLHWRFGLARRSRIVRVNNHQIGFISTHRKIGHSPSIKWYQITGWSMSFIVCYPFSFGSSSSYRLPEKPKKSRLELCPATFFASHFHSIIWFVEFVCFTRRLLLVYLCFLFIFFFFHPDCSPAALSIVFFPVSPLPTPPSAGPALDRAPRVSP